MKDHIDKKWPLAERYMKFHRRIKLPEGLVCPITKKPMELDADADSPDFIYVTTSGKRWKYDYRQGVFIEMCKAGRAYEWGEAECKWYRMVKMCFDCSFGKTFSTNSKYVRMPKTNWEDLVLQVTNFVYTNEFCRGVLTAWRWLFPKRILFPVIRKIAAKTVAMDLVSVQPLPGPSGKLVYIDFKYDGQDDKPVETKQQEHVIIKKEDNPSNNK